MYPEPEAPEFGDDDSTEEALSSEPLDVEALVRKARRSHQIAEADVQTILATANEEEAEALYE
ncbi:MAG TPA: hypothetical protein PLH39_06455, partial [Promineifilum sp.]|nr:hypothetical protein [Promineifilum sp.]